MPGTNSWQLRDGEQVISCSTSLLGHRHFLIGITRVRNEALVLRDTLDYVGKHVDAIVAYDDASTDRTLEILREHPKIALIVANQSWESRFPGLFTIRNGLMATGQLTGPGLGAVPPRTPA